MSRSEAGMQPEPVESAASGTLGCLVAQSGKEFLGEVHEAPNKPANLKIR